MSNFTRDFLTKQSKVFCLIADKGEDCTIIGRGAEIALVKYNPLKLFAYASGQAYNEPLAGERLLPVPYSPLTGRGASDSSG